MENKIEKYLKINLFVEVYRRKKNLDHQKVHIFNFSFTLNVKTLREKDVASCSMLGLISCFLLNMCFISN